MPLKRKVMSLVVALVAVMGLAASPASAATTQATVYGPSLPLSVPAGYSIYFNGVAPAQPGVTSVCTTFTVSGTGSVSVYLYGEPSGKTFASPGTHTYCSTNSAVLYYASSGRATPVFTVGAPGPVTFHAVSIRINTYGSTG